MKVNDILKLIDAGYNRDEIMAMEANADQISETASLPESPEAEPDSIPEVSAAPAPEPAKDNTSELIAALTKQVASLTQQITRSNLLNAQQPAEPEADSAEKVLASIINPSYRKGK